MTILDLPRQTKIEYPESDGKPMAETDTHIQLLSNVREMLKDFFRDDSQIYVAGNLLFYYEEGEPSSSVAPDVFVVKGVTKQDRRTYKMWVENRAPCVVFEFTSRSTRLEDMGNKKTLYAMLGVQEYFVCDPLGEYLTPPLQGFDLKRGDYVRMSPEPDGALISGELGLRLKLEDRGLRLIDIKTGEPLLTPAEAQERARMEAKARHKAETEVERLREELKKLRGEK
jgi:Uma2 family endonuclease